jgi:hypothetical protein
VVGAPAAAPAATATATTTVAASATTAGAATAPVASPAVIASPVIASLVIASLVIASPVIASLVIAPVVIAVVIAVAIVVVIIAIVIAVVTARGDLDLAAARLTRPGVAHAERRRSFLDLRGNLHDQTAHCAAECRHRGRSHSDGPAMRRSESDFVVTCGWVEPGAGDGEGRRCTHRADGQQRSAVSVLHSDD